MLLDPIRNRLHLLRMQRRDGPGGHANSGSLHEMERLVALFRQRGRPILPQPGGTGMPHYGVEPGTALPPRKIATTFVRLKAGGEGFQTGFKRARLRTGRAPDV
jgi:hypothetical protein